MQIRNKVQKVDIAELGSKLARAERIEVVGFVGKPSDTLDITQYMYIGVVSSEMGLRYETVRAEKCIKVDGVKIIGYGMYVEGEKDAEV